MADRTDGTDRTSPARRLVSPYPTTPATGPRRGVRPKRPLRALPQPTGYALTPAYLRRLGQWVHATRLAAGETQRDVMRMLRADAVDRSVRSFRDLEMYRYLPDDADVSHVIIHYPALRWLALHYHTTLDALDAYCSGVIDSPLAYTSPAPASASAKGAQQGLGLLLEGMSAKQRELVEVVARLTPDQLTHTVSFALWLIDRDLQGGIGATYTPPALPAPPIFTAPPLADRLQTEQAVEQLRAAQAQAQAEADGKRSAGGGGGGGDGRATANGA